MEHGERSLNSCSFTWKRAIHVGVYAAKSTVDVNSYDLVVGDPEFNDGCTSFWNDLEGFRLNHKIFKQNLL
jgi:hypothetical protein